MNSQWGQIRALSASTPRHPADLPYTTSNPSSPRPPSPTLLSAALFARLLGGIIGWKHWHSPHGGPPPRSTGVVGSSRSPSYEHIVLSPSTLLSFTCLGQRGGPDSTSSPRVNGSPAFPMRHWIRTVLFRFYFLAMLHLRGASRHPGRYCRRNVLWVRSNALDCEVSSKERERMTKSRWPKSSPSLSEDEVWKCRTTTRRFHIGRDAPWEAPEGQLQVTGGQSSLGISGNGGREV